MSPILPFSESPALKFKVLAKCSVSKARTSVLSLPHYDVSTPIFMPVGTQATMKGLTTAQLEALDCQIILSNTYHLALHPGQQMFDSLAPGRLHEFMKWKRAILTDSGGFQMVSLLALSKITEEGVEFLSPRDNSPMLLTPEKSIEMQNAIGADIMMQLDDVVNPMSSPERVEEAMWRSIRWLDRSLAAHSARETQNLFPIIQGGLHCHLRKICLDEMIKRDCPGYAIGGLSGGEEKDDFWRIVSMCTDELPEGKPRYCMGIGYAEDLVVCSALGVDMFDCVFPTRTARFGYALTDFGSLVLKKSTFEADNRPILEGCPCTTCRDYSRSQLHNLFRRKETVACHLTSIHNIAYQMGLMRRIRESIVADAFPQFVRRFMFDVFRADRAQALNLIPSDEDKLASSRSDTPDYVVNNGDEKKRSVADAGFTEKKEATCWGSLKRPAIAKSHLVDARTTDKLDERGYPIWIVNALRSVNIELE